MPRPSGLPAADFVFGEAAQGYAAQKDKLHLCGIGRYVIFMWLSACYTLAAGRPPGLS